MMHILYCTTLRFCRSTIQSGGTGLFPVLQGLMAKVLFWLWLFAKDRHLVRQGSALAHWAAGAVKANAERQLEPH